MKILFFGLGSIGQRHLKLLTKKFPIESLYSYRTSAKFNSTTNIPKNIQDLNDLSPDVAFICNPTSLHIETAQKAAQKGAHLFIEKPICNSIDGLDDLLNEIKTKKLTAYIAYHLRFHPGVKELRSRIQTLLHYGKYRAHARIIVTSHLPSWRPNKNYLDIYSSQKKLGGGVLLDLSHELDLAEYLFGEYEISNGSLSKNSSVAHDCEDAADLLLKNSNFHINVHMNFFSIVEQRSITVDFDDCRLQLDLISNELIHTKKLHNEQATIDRISYSTSKDLMFRDQHDYFFENLNNPNLMNNIFEASNLFKKIIHFKERTEVI